METSTKPKAPRGRPKQQDNSQIIGFRLPKELAREVKTEASQRGMKLNDLFAELWEQHKRQGNRPSKS